MPNSGSTIAVDSSTTTGSPAALAYGYVWATGVRAAYYEIQNTGTATLDYTRVGMWILGEGEWDGCQELWINNEFVWASQFDDPTQFHFHPGVDATIGASMLPNSSGTDQGVDSFWAWFPSAITPLPFSRMANYAIFRKQPVENQTTGHQNDPTQWTDIAPIGLWRALKVRIFDDEGTQTGYAFSTNPVWQWVDLKLRRQVFPEYTINGAEAMPVPSECLARFNWGDIYASASYCDQLIQTAFGPRPRFSSSAAFNQQTTLAAIEEQIMKVCRGYTREYAGQMSFLIDRPRASVFTFSRGHILPGSFSPSDKTVSQQGNAFVARFRDLMVPASANIASITVTAPGANPVVTTEDPHCYNAGDRIAMGGTETNYDGAWSVYSVPAGASTNQFTIQSKGSNYPLSVGPGGVVGLLASRFKERAPVFNHENNQLAKGALGVGIPRLMNPVPVTLDLAVCTFDQASRIARYEKDRSLGLDIDPYATPPALSFRSPMYASDAAGSGAVAKQIQPGDRITLDSTASWAYQGDYEVIKRTDRPFGAQAKAGGNTIALTPDAQGGTIQWQLGPYSEVVFYDSTDPATAGWSSVPGSDPGNNGDYTAIDLADGGQLAFISGAIASGGTFQLPSTGFTVGQVLAWASPQGYLESGHAMCVVSECYLNPGSLQGTLVYEDGSSNFWNGDLNIAAAAWIGDATAATLDSVGVDDSYVFNWLLCTLAGGEEICIGQGFVPDGTTLELPAGFAWSQAFGLAAPTQGSPAGAAADGYGAYVDSDGTVHLAYTPGGSGTAQVLVWAWKNNSGAVTTQTTGGATWMLYNTSTGFTLGVGLGTFANGATLGLPEAAGAANSLQIFPTIHSFTDTDQQAHGVGGCYVDSSLKVNAYFSNPGGMWNAEADVFALFYEPTAGSGASTGGISVQVVPSGVQMALSATQQFSAVVLGTSNTAVNWSVNGIPGGSSDVGTIDDTGLYTAPDINGTFLITATSQENTAAEGWQFVQVGTGGGLGGGGGVGFGGNISVQPLNIPSMPPGGGATFTATTSEAAAVTWGASGGTLTPSGTDNTVCAWVAPSQQGTYTITAFATVNGIAVSASATVTVGTHGPGG